MAPVQKTRKLLKKMPCLNGSTAVPKIFDGSRSSAMRSSTGTARRGEVLTLGLNKTSKKIKKALVRSDLVKELAAFNFGEGEAGKRRPGQQLRNNPSLTEVDNTVKELLERATGSFTRKRGRGSKELKMPQPNPVTLDEKEEILGAMERAIDEYSEGYDAAASASERCRINTEKIPYAKLLLGYFQLYFASLEQATETAEVVQAQPTVVFLVTQNQAVMPTGTHARMESPVLPSGQEQQVGDRDWAPSQLPEETPNQVQLPIGSQQQDDDEQFQDCEPFQSVEDDTWHQWSEQIRGQDQQSLIGSTSAHDPCLGAPLNSPILTDESFYETPEVGLSAVANQPDDYVSKATYQNLLEDYKKLLKEKAENGGTFGRGSVPALKSDGQGFQTATWTNPGTSSSTDILALSPSLKASVDINDYLDVISGDRPIISADPLIFGSDEFSSVDHAYDSDSSWWELRQTARLITVLHRFRIPVLNNDQ